MSLKTAAADVSEVPVLLKPRDVVGDGRELLIVRTEGGDSDVPQFFAYRQGRLQHLAVAQNTPPLTGSIDADGRVLRWWFDGQDRLFSARSTKPLGQASSVPVEVFRWTVQPAPGGGPLLAATKLPGTRCYDLVNGETTPAC